MWVINLGLILDGPLHYSDSPRAPSFGVLGMGGQGFSIFSKVYLNLILRRHHLWIIKHVIMNILGWHREGSVMSVRELLCPSIIYLLAHHIFTQRNIIYRLTPWGPGDQSEAGIWCWWPMRGQHGLTTVICPRGGGVRLMYGVLDCVRRVSHPPLLSRSILISFLIS